MNKLYMVTVFYSHKDGRTIEAVAVVGAADGIEAIEMANDAVRAFPHCAKVLGGICEELPEGTAPIAAAEQRITEQHGRPASATLH